GESRRPRAGRVDLAQLLAPTRIPRSWQPPEPSMRLTLPALLLAAAAGATAAEPADRGQLLYTTHCIECHTAQMHWRAGRLARDWDGLRAQVTRWQATGALNWTPADIDAVTRYLNETIYRFPRAQASATPAGAAY